ncbi:VirB4 family type IV secretion system protein [Streptomyces noursei]|uniref:VirB4 family type IV secretion system protein n=1 Tax=Streptomyces noursei TaxID=1971 RepID=UPI00043532D0|nr:conjugal transfer protein TraC [Streptomyces noursei]EXU87870.1 conjugal transfer protein TraC [Streptomyces noursei PD-1]UWS75377.1 conjugal transfer protein TraC [Streptomyces noursei]
MPRLLPSRRRPHASAPVTDVGSLLDVAGPESLEIHARALAIGAHLATTVVVIGYPAEVTPGWLAPLLNFPGHLDIALHIEPVPNSVAAAGLKKQRARLESGRRAGFTKGHLDDPEVEAAAADAAELAYRIARGEGKLFHVALYLTVHAPDEETLADQAAAVRAIAESLLMTVAPTTYRALPGWLATLPLGIDTLKIRRTFDTAALAACFPFTSPDLPLPTGAEGGDPGVLYGLNVVSSAPVLWDRFAQDNYNSITLARSGAGKSYLTKLELLRLLFTGVTASVIDPEDEYVRLAETVGGHVVALGADGVRLNPFDLPTSAPDGEDVLTRRVLFLHTFLAALLGSDLSAAEKAVLDKAILVAYTSAGITPDPRTWQRTPPTLADLATLLAEDGTDTATALADRLVPYTTGSHAQLFNGPSTVSATGHLLVFALRRLPDEAKTPAMLLALDAIWRQATARPDAGRHLVVVDEAWLLMRDGAGARFLFRMAKAARKYWTGLAVVTQDADDVLASPLGRAIVSNAATQILLRQAPQAIEVISENFHLCHGEREFLLSASRGEALLLTGDRRHKVALTSVAAPGEHNVITTDPGELAAQNRDDAPQPDSRFNDELPGDEDGEWAP